MSPGLFLIHTIAQDCASAWNVLHLHLVLYLNVCHFLIISSPVLPAPESFLDSHLQLDPFLLWNPRARPLHLFWCSPCCSLHLGLAVPVQSWCLSPISCLRIGSLSKLESSQEFAHSRFSVHNFKGGIYKCICNIQKLQYYLCFVNSSSILFRWSYVKSALKEWS